MPTLHGLAGTETRFGRDGGVLKSCVSGARSGHRGEPPPCVSVTRGNGWQPRRLPAKPWQLRLPRKSGPRGMHSRWEGAWGSLSSQLGQTLSMVPTASGFTFPFPTLMHRGSGALRTGEIPVSWYQGFHLHRTPQHLANELTELACPRRSCHSRPSVKPVPRADAASLHRAEATALTSPRHRAAFWGSASHYSAF